ncbi:MAG: NAD(P)H-binding protein [Bryobacteraceae bacterium]
MQTVFITGATGYMGIPLAAELLRRGHRVRALVRPNSAANLPAGCEPITGSALDSATFRHRVAPADTFIQLVGVPHPSPAKAAQFRAVDLASVRASVDAASGAGIRHFVYVSVAHPAPTMKAYVAIRMEAEALIRSAGLNATILRPWYVLGPGHRWPLALTPVYWLMEHLPATRESALRLGLVKLPQMVHALANAVEEPVHGIRVLGVPEIRQAGERL